MPAYLKTPMDLTLTSKGSGVAPKRRESFLRHGLDPELFLKTWEEDNLREDLKTSESLSNKQTVMTLLGENAALMDEIDEANRVRDAKQGLGPHPLREEGRFSEPYGDAPNPLDLANQMGPKRSRATGPRPDPNTYAMAPEARLFTDPSPHAIGEEARFMEPYAEAPHPQAQPSPLRSALGRLGQGPHSGMPGHATEQDPFALTPPDPGYGRSDHPFTMTPPDRGSDMPLYGQGQNYGQNPLTPQYRHAQAPSGGYGANPAGGPAAGYAQQVSYRPSGPQPPAMPQFYNTAASTSGPAGPVGINAPHPAAGSSNSKVEGGFGTDRMDASEDYYNLGGWEPEVYLPAPKREEIPPTIFGDLMSPDATPAEKERALKALKSRFPIDLPSHLPNSEALDSISILNPDGTDTNTGIVSDYYLKRDYPPRPEGVDYWPADYIWEHMV